MVSVIILTKNRAQLLKKTIKNILTQTYKDFEIIIADNGSDDETADEVKGIHDDRIKYFNIGNGGNFGKNRNIAITKCKYSLIAFCDDDDLWHHQKLEKQLHYINETGIVCTDAKHIDDDGNTLHSYILGKKYLNLLINKKALLYQNIIMQSSVLVKKDLLYGNGLYNEVTHCEDYELWLRITESTNIFFLSEILVDMRVHKKGSSRNYESDIKNKEHSISYQINAIKNGDNDTITAGKSGIFRNKILLAKSRFMNKNYLKSFYEILSSLRYILNINVIMFFIRTKLNGKNIYLVYAPKQ